MTPEQLGEICDKINGLWGFSDIEIALEANPHEMNAEDWRDYRAAGLNRLSLGIQTFNDKALDFLGRDHDSETAQAALDLALDIFPNVSSDLIFGWAGQTKQNLAHDLKILLKSGLPHISTYQLTIEDGTAFAKAETRGQNNITIDNQRQATVAHMRPKAYADAVKQMGCGLESRETLLPEDRAAEYLLMGLRIDEGISLDFACNIRRTARSECHHRAPFIARIKKAPSLGRSFTQLN